MRSERESKSKRQVLIHDPADSRVTSMLPRAEGQVNFRGAPCWAAGITGMQIWYVLTRSRGIELPVQIGVAMAIVNVDSDTGVGS